MSKNLLLIIEEALSCMSVSERRVAQLCLHSPSEFLGKSLFTISQEAFVSKPTVIRFYRRLGFTKFSELISELRSNIVEGVPYIHYGVKENFSTEQVLASICEKTIHSIRTFREVLSTEALEQCADAIAHSHLANRRIHLLGLGGSGLVAQDGALKLQRLGINATALTDAYTQTVGLSHLGEGDTALFISNSGQTIALTQACQRVRLQGVRTLALTQSASALFCAAKFTLPIDHLEQFELYCPMNARHLQLIALDVLTTCVSLKVNSHQLGVQLQAMTEALGEVRVIGFN